MADRESLLIGGYCFGSYQDARLAEEEQKKIEYFRKKINGRSPQSLLAVYDKILDEKVFQTPVGWEYLREIQGQLYKLGVPEEQIRPLPMYVTFSHMTGDDLEKSRVRQRIRSVRPKKKINKFRISVWVNIFLAILVMAMFVITLKSDNPNILNYKQTIIDQYASWEQDLTEREQAVREKEHQLQIQP